MQSLGNFWFNLIFLLLIQCNRLAMIDLIQTLEFLFNLILEIFIQSILHFLFNLTVTKFLIHFTGVSFP